MAAPSPQLVQFGPGNRDAAVKTPLTPVLTHSCPHCGNKLETSGSYFWRTRFYYCPHCEQPVALSYEDKLKLFDRAARSRGQTTSET